MKKVIVASINPVKINTTQFGFLKMFPKETFSFQGVSAESLVSNQPMSEEETLQGATNRATNASILFPKVDFWVGIEGGLEEINNEMLAFAWVVVLSKEKVVGRGRSASFFIPAAVAHLIKNGKELGEADDIVFGKTNSKQANGATGILTHDVVTRTDLYLHAIIMSLIPFKNPNLY